MQSCDQTLCTASSNRLSLPFEIDAEEAEEAKHTTVLSAQKRDKKPEETAGEEEQKDDDSVAAETEPAAVNTPGGRRTKFRSAAFSAGKCEDCNDKRYDAVAVIDLLASC